LPLFCTFNACRLCSALLMCFFFSSRRRHTRSVSAFLLNRSSDLVTVFSFTIDHRPEGDEKWFLENEKTVTQFCRKLAAERPLKRSEERRVGKECRSRCWYYS